MFWIGFPTNGLIEVADREGKGDFETESPTGMVADSSISCAKRKSIAVAKFLSRASRNARRERFRTRTAAPAHLGGRAAFKLLIGSGLSSLSLWPVSSFAEGESRASARRGRQRRTSPRLGSTLLRKEGGVKGVRSVKCDKKLLTILVHMCYSGFT